MPKYKEVFDDMMEYNKDLFEGFQKIHDNFSINPDKWKKGFDETGEEVLTIIRRYERILCGHTESGKYSKFSTSLSEKFWSEVRRHFPKIDFIGISE